MATNDADPLAALPLPLTLTPYSYWPQTLMPLNPTGPYPYWPLTLPSQWRCEGPLAPACTLQSPLERHGATVLTLPPGSTTGGERKLVHRSRATSSVGREAEDPLPQRGGTPPRGRYPKPPLLIIWTPFPRGAVRLPVEGILTRTITLSLTVTLIDP